jgi:hypothetical protein
VAAGIERGIPGLSPVIADSFDRAAFLGFLATGFFFRRAGLLEDVRVAAVLVSLEVIGRGLAAEIAIYALIVNVVFARDVLRIFISSVSHKVINLCPPIWRALPLKASPFRLLFAARDGGWWPTG